jgi:long-chain acyl-CoA synthetase
MGRAKPVAKSGSKDAAVAPAVPAQWLSSGARRRTAAEISERAQRAAGGFISAGVSQGDAIALLLRNDFAFFEASLAAGTVGAYAVPINWHATQDEVEYILADSGARILVAHADLLACFARLLPVKVLVVETPPEIGDAYDVPKAHRHSAEHVDWDDFIGASSSYGGPPIQSRGAIIYTSGTTGRPKGVKRNPAKPEVMFRMQHAMVVGYGLMPDRAMTVLMNGPMYHSAPNSYARGALLLGANFVLQPKFDPEGLLHLIEENRVTHMHIVPTMFHRLLKLPESVRTRYDLSSLIDVVHGAAPCPPAVKKAMIEWWGPVISEYYGSTETALVTRVTSWEALTHPGTVGRALPGCEVIVVGSQKERLPAGAVGEIFVRNDNMPNFTYHGDQQKRADIELDGFVTAGDVGFLDPDGYLYLSDRKKDMIISGGVNIYPAEIEAAIMALPGVKDCAVFGGPDDEFGERVIAHVELEAASDLDAPTLIEELSATLAKYKLPKTIEFSDALPREDSGKIFKRRLRESYWKAAGRNI